MIPHRFGFSFAEDKDAVTNRRRTQLRQFPLGGISTAALLFTK
jgi:hypothetical protein